MKAIEKWAADEFRSVNGQIEWMLNNSLKEAKRIKVKTVVKKQCPNVIGKKLALSYGIFVGGKSVQRLTYNVMQLQEVGDFEAQNLQPARKFD